MSSLESEESNVIKSIFKVGTEGKTNFEIVVSIAVPERGNEEWSSCISISYPGETIELLAHGIEPLSCLSNALKAVRFTMQKKSPLATFEGIPYSELIPYTIFSSNTELTKSLEKSVSKKIEEYEAGVAQKR